MGMPVTFVDSGGIPVTVTSNGTPVTPVDAGGAGAIAVTVSAYGMPVTLENEFGPWFEDEALALFARAPTQTALPPFARMNVINSFIFNLKSAGLWTKFDALWVSAAHDSSFARLNLVSGSYNLSTTTGTVTFTADRGFAGNGVDGALPAAGMTLSALAKALQNDAHISTWILAGTDAAATKVALGLIGTSGSFAIRPRDVSGTLSGPVNSATVSIFAAQGTIIGDSLITRTGATALAGYKNGAAAGTDTDASTTRSGSQVALFRGGSVFCDYQIAIASVGASLTAQEASDFYDFKEAYLQAVGAIA